VTSGGVTPIDLERAAEAVRQERETFDMQKSHVERWFRLRLAMGYSSIVLLCGIMVVSTDILLQPGKFPSGVLTTAGGALFTDVLGLLVSVWRIALNPDLIGRLSPVTKTGPSV